MLDVAVEPDDRDEVERLVEPLLTAPRLATLLVMDPQGLSQPLGQGVQIAGRLGQIVDGPPLHGRHGRAFGATRGDDHQRHALRLFVEPIEGPLIVEPPRRQLTDDEIEGLGRELPLEFLARAGHDHAKVALALKAAAHGLALGRTVVNDQQGELGGCR